jgi:uncharacterized membrane protein
MKLTDYKQLKPTSSGSFSHGWDVMKYYFLHLFLVIMACAVAGSMLGIGKDIEEHSAAGVLLGLIGTAFFFLVLPVINWGANLIFLQAVRNEKPQLELLIAGFKNNYLKIVLANLLAVSLIMLGFVALIIPGIIIACRLAFVSYLVMDKNLDPIEAVEESWRMTRGYGWTIFGMAILSIFIAIGGLIALIVGIFFAIIWINASFATIYQSVLNEKEVLIQPIAAESTEE